MKIARAILTHRQEMVPLLKRYYLDSPRTNFLVIAYNQVSVKPESFEQSASFKLFPYLGKGPRGSIFGQMFLVWGELAKAFPEVDAWVIHDYDVVINPTDQQLTSHITDNEYGMVGKAFVYNKQTIHNASDEDLFPFLKSGLRLSLGNSSYKYLEDELLKTYPVTQNGQQVVLTGYGDFIVAHKKVLELLTAQNLKSLKNGGSEQVPHTVFAHFGIKPVDLKKIFSCFVSLDNTLYADVGTKYDISHPAKFWPGLAKPTLKMQLKRFIKRHFIVRESLVSLPK